MYSGFSYGLAYPEYDRISAVLSRFSLLGLSSVGTPVWFPLMAVRNNLDAAVTSGRFSFANVAANKTILSFFGRIMLVAPLGIWIPNLNI